jgi:hypothetical protein
MSLIFFVGLLEVGFARSVLLSFLSSWSVARPVACLPRALVFFGFVVGLVRKVHGVVLVRRAPGGVRSVNGGRAGMVAPGGGAQRRR